MQLAELTQELVDLPGEMRVLEATEAVAKYVRLGKLELTASSVLERLGFPAARQWTPVGQLSGGERRRLQLTRLLMAEPNVLLLDEPTNDLDVDTLARLEDLLDGWPGTLVVVSHDRYLVERVCDTVVALLGDGKVTHLPGGIEEYLARRARHGRVGEPLPRLGVGVGVRRGVGASGRIGAARYGTGRRRAAALGRRAAGRPQGGSPAGAAAGDLGRAGEGVARADGRCRHRPGPAAVARRRAARRRRRARERRAGVARGRGGGRVAAVARRHDRVERHVMVLGTAVRCRSR